MGSVGKMGRVGKRDHHLSARQCGALGSDNADYRTTLSSNQKKADLQQKNLGSLRNLRSCIVNQNTNFPNFPNLPIKSRRLLTLY